MVICSFTKWRVPGDSELQESSTTAALSQKSQQYCSRLQVLSTDKMLEVGKATISGQSIDLMILCSSFCTAWCAKAGWSQPGPAQESLLCAPLPNYTLSDISLLAWSLSRQEYLHHRKWQMLQMSAPSLRASYSTFTSMLLVTMLVHLRFGSRENRNSLVLNSL